MSRCFYCCQPLLAAAPDYHLTCSRKLFGKPTPPTFPYSEAQLLALAEQIVRSHITVTGVQPKLSLTLAATSDARQPARFTIVGALGTYILKPSTPHYPSLPEVEDLTMHLAALAGLATLPHGLLRLEGGALAYVIRRIDRHQGRSWLWRTCASSPNGSQSTSTTARMSRWLRPSCNIPLTRAWM